MNKILYTTAIMSLLPTSSWAHSGHVHTPAETLSGMLHTLATHPLLFGVIGLALLGAMLYRRQ